MKRTSLILVTLLAALALWSVPGSSAWKGKLDQALIAASQHSANQPVRVLIRTRGRAAAHVQGRINAVRGGHSWISTSPDLLVAELPLGELRTIASDPDVERVSSDAPVKSLAKSSDLDDDVLLGTEALLPRTYTGRNIGVAVIDSGMVPGKDLDNVTASYTFLSGSPVQQNPKDAFGHGTHVAGLIGSDGSTTNGLYQGIAPGVRFIVLQVLDENGAGYTSNVVNAINFAIANKTAYGIDVINLSLGHPIYEPAADDPLVQAVENAVASGIVVVASAGNFGGDPTTHEVGYGGITSPGNAPDAITVGAIETNDTVTRDDDVVAWYSSRGPTWYDAFQKPDLVAPGGHLASDVPDKCSLIKDYPRGVIKTAGKCNLMRLSGTSMSAAVVTGAVAAVLEASRTNHPGTLLPPNAVKAILQYTAFTMPNYDTLTQGAGALNIGGALELAAAIDPNVAAGSWWLATGVATSTTVGGQTLAWGQRVVWGDRVIWGNQLFTNDPAWALRVIWGNRVVWGDRVIWGNSTVFDGNQVVWGNRVIWGNALIGESYGPATTWGSLDNDATTANRVVWGNLEGLGGASTSTSLSNLERSNMDIK